MCQLSMAVMGLHMMQSHCCALVRHCIACGAPTLLVSCPPACLLCSSSTQVVGVCSLFFMPAPLLLKQCYLVWVGIITAYIFTYIPEWTSWVLLVMMAVYDLVAVLLPGGPLKVRQGQHKHTASS